jgi:5-hydroxyisourate hydrolase-like protein (transthyretin family)
MTSRRDVIDLLIMENANLIGGYQSHLDVEEYYESITLPKKLSTTEFIEVVNVEVQKSI